MVRDRRLADITAGREFAGADLVEVAQLAQDRQARGVGGGLKEQHVGIGLSFHRVTVLTSIYLDKYQYRSQTTRWNAGATR